MPSPQPDDAEDARNIADARLGDHEAFGRLYDAHHRRVFALLLRLERDEQVAAALLQETFIQAWRGLRAFRGAAAFGSWLHAIAVRTHLMHARQRTRQARHISDASDFDAQTYAIAAREAMPETAIDLERALARLPDGARRVAILCLVVGYSYADAASMLGLRIGTLKSQLSRARTLLQQWLDQ